MPLGRYMNYLCISMCLYQNGSRRAILFLKIWRVLFCCKWRFYGEELLNLESINSKCQPLGPFSFFKILICSKEEKPRSHPYMFMYANAVSPGMKLSIRTSTLFSRQPGIQSFSSKAIFFCFHPFRILYQCTNHPVSLV